MDKVSIIMAVHNRAELTLKCFDSLSQSTSYPDWELVVVDNASTDDTPDILNALEGEVKILRANENLGFARANNWGARESSGELLCFLNNDTVVTKGWLNKLVECIEAHPGAAACGGKLLFPEGTIQHAGVVFDKIDRIGYHVYRGFPANAPEVNRLRRVKAVTGACMLVRRWAFEDAGGFDEGYVNGFEDIDLCLKLGENHGEIYYTPECTVIHHTSATAGRMEHDQSNAVRFASKWFDRIIPDEDLFLAEDGYRAEWRGTNCTLKQVHCDIIIPTYNNIDYTKRCIDSILRNTRFPNFNIIVVDNGSTDGTVEYIRSLTGLVRVIANEINLGFAAACNKGAAASKADYLLFLNNDTEVSAEWLAELVKSASVEDVGAVGGKLLYPDGTIQHAGVVFDKLDGVAYHIYAGQPGEAIYVNRGRDFQAVTGACMLVKRDDFREAGMFDEEYLNGREDIDLCLKLGEMGRKIHYNPRCCVIHYESKTKGRKTHDRANLERLISKWGDRIRRDEDEYHREDNFRVIWDDRMSYHLEYCGPRAGILVEASAGVRLLDWIQSIMEATAFPDYLLYLKEDEGVELPPELKEVVRMVKGGNILQVAKRIAEPIVCAVGTDFRPPKGWLSNLVRWGEDVGGGELIINGIAVRGKGHPELQGEIVRKVKFFTLKNQI